MRFFKKKISFLNVIVFLIFAVGVTFMLQTGNAVVAQPPQPEPGDPVLPGDRTLPMNPILEGPAAPPLTTDNRFDDAARIIDSFTEGLTTPATPNAARTTLTHTSYTFRALTCFILG